MRLALLWFVALPSLAQEPDVQRALIERDQRTVEFAARLQGAPLVELQRLENAAARQQLEVRKDLPQELRPYERQEAAREFVLRLPPPVVRADVPDKPRPLPAAMPGVVDVVPSAAPSPGRSLQNFTEDRSAR
jgi:hypothetical protein